MYNNFAHIIENATSQKRLFDSSIESVKDLLDQSVRGSVENPENIHKVEFARNGFRTGWALHAPNTCLHVDSTCQNWNTFIPFV